MESFLTSVFGAAATAIQAVLSFWKIIVGWAQESLASWISNNLSFQFKDLVTEALVILDKVASPANKAAKIAWKTLRKFLTKSIITFEKKVLPNNKFQWYRKWSSSIINIVNPQEPKIEREVTITPVHFEDLPDDVRALLIRSGDSQHELNFLDIRDREMEEMVA